MAKHVWKVLPALLMGIYPVWQMQSHPESWSQIASAFRISLIVTTITLLLIWLLKFILADITKRAVVVTIFWACAYLFSPMSRLLLIPLLRSTNDALPWLTSVEVMRNTEITRIVSLLCTIGILLPVIFLLRKSKSNFALFTLVINSFLGVMLIISVGQTITWYLRNHTSVLGVPQWTVGTKTIQHDRLQQNLQSSQPMPDIYMIVVDGYARSDVLAQYYGVDNQEFLDELSARGFQTTSHSQSNYMQTYFSLASSLNMNYLDPLRNSIGLDSTDREPLRYLIRYNSVAESLRRIGYEYVVIPSTFLLSAIQGSPVDLCLYDGAMENSVLWQYLAHTSLGWWLPSQFNYTRHRDGIENVLHTLATVPPSEQPQFVFAHVLAPHPPFVFNEDGSLRENWYLYSLNDGTGYFGSEAEYVEGYRNQVAYLNQELLKVIDAIQARAETPPVIIIQADHGPGSMLDWDSMENTNLRERLSIFSSFYLPGQDVDVEDDLTPVNNFRMIFNRYFGTDYAMLENRSYYATWTRPYAWERVTAPKQ